MKIIREIDAAFQKARSENRPLELQTLAKATSLALSDDNQFSADEKSAIARGWAAFAGPGGPGASEQAATYFGVLQSQHGVEGLPEARPPDPAARHGLRSFGGKVGEVGLPPFLTSGQFPVQDVVGALGPFSTAHLGGGLLLTNRHVYEHPFRTAKHEGSFAGREKLRSNQGDVFLRMLPDLGSYQLQFNRAAGDLRSFNDFALMEKPAHAASQGVTLRRTDSLAPGEPLWVIGDADGGGKPKISAGRFSELVGSNAAVRGLETENGFSGSPVLDAQGRMVGLFFASARQDGESFGLMVRTETIAAAVAAARAKDPSLPALELVG